MVYLRKSKHWVQLAVCVAALVASLTRAADDIIVHLKNGDRLTGTITSETAEVLNLQTSIGAVQVPVTQVDRREAVLQSPTVRTNVAATGVVSTNTVPGTNSVAFGPPVPKKMQPKPPLSPANPEATPIASTAKFWKHDLRFGLNLRYSTRDSQEFSIIEKSIYGRPPFRHIFDVNFRYGRLDGQLAANALVASEKTEYQLSPRSYIFGLAGGGYDEIRKIDLQFELGPGYGMELLKLTNFVWKSEIGFNFQQQFRSDDTRSDVYSVRIAEIFAWRIWEKLTADAKIEFFPSISEVGEYRLRLESTLRYPVSKILSLNLDVIDLFDTQPARNIPENDLQIRSSIGVTF